MSTLKVGEIKHENFTGTTQLKLDNSGRLLLGTTTEGHANADDLTVSSSGDTGLTIRSGTSNLGNIYFSDATSGDGEYRGIVQYEHANDKLNFGTAAGTRLSIDSSGAIIASNASGYHADADDLVLKERSGSNVGINLLNTTAGYGVIYFGDSSDNDAGRIQYDHPNDSLDLFTAGSERMTINSAGNCGLGTTSPGYKLEVVDSAALLKLNSSNEGNYDLRFVYQNSEANIWSYGSKDLTFGTRYDKKLHFVTNGPSKRVTIDSAGKVGIGTTSPTEILHIKEGTNKNLHFTGGIGQIGNVTGFFAVNDANDAIEDLGMMGDTLRFASGSAASGAERMRIESGGTVNIGTTSSDSDTQFLNIQAPQAAGKHSLHLQGHATSSYSGTDVLKCVLHGFYRQSYGQNGFLFKNADDHTHNRGVRVHKYVRSDGNECGSIFYNSSSTSFNTSSDYRLKENEVLISDGITRIKQLKPYKFNFKGLSDVVDGFFAHEVAEVVPEAVVGVKDGMVPNAWYKEGDTIPAGKAVDDVKGYSDTEMEIQQLDYSKLVTVTIAALQEAVSKIEVLETKVAALEAA